ncbi:hypothetical protein BH11GEM2_BH11GEM2_37290 [soil metagenome]
MSIRRETLAEPSPFERALAERGLVCRVEPRAGLAVLIADRATMTALTDPEVRRTTLALAREHGFTHVAVELRDDAAQ